MTKMTFALAAALLAGTTMTSAANAGGVHLGFGFPLGSFVAHPNENYDSGRDYRRYDRPHHTRRDDQDEAPARRVAKIKRAPKADVAAVPVKAPETPVVKTAKTEDKLSSDPSTTTVLEKTATAATVTTPAADAKTTASIADASSSKKTDKIATSDVAETSAKSDDKPDADNTKHVCRRYSAAIAGLVDVPCE